MEAAEARKVADDARGGKFDQENLGAVVVTILQNIGGAAKVGLFHLEADISPYKLSPGNESLLVIELRGKGYSCHPRTGGGGTVLDIAW